MVYINHESSPGAGEEGETVALTLGQNQGSVRREKGRLDGELSTTKSCYKDRYEIYN